MIANVLMTFVAIVLTVNQETDGEFFIEDKSKKNRKKKVLNH